MKITYYQSVLTFFFLIGLWPCTASALMIEIVTSRDDFLQVALTEIAQVEGRVYRLDAESGFVSFGDGLSGARPPSERSGVIGSYSFGGGTEGNIFNEFDLLSVELPFAIPLSELLDPQSNDKSINFVLVGISALEFDLTSENFIVTAARINALPAPSILTLIVLGLAGIVFTRQRKSA